ncbi:NB-ARC domain-containing protein [Saccharothrix sp. AJ9571]|nr:NB-ARC domain-containing protein [Saccharothrix sp. AJ9571]
MVLKRHVASCAPPGQTGCMGDQRAGSDTTSVSVAGSEGQAGSIGQVIVPVPVQGSVPVPRQLPASVRDFTGRERQVAALDSMLPNDAAAHSTVVVLGGTGGVGKTTLVTYWAHRVQEHFRDGTLFVNLRGYGPSAPLDSVVVLGSFLAALGVAQNQVPAELEAAVGLFRSLLATRRVLVVLDNAATAEQVRPLLPTTAGCMAVVTSRDSLTDLFVFESAHRISLDLLATAESYALLQAVLGPARLEHEPDAASELVELCAGLPLAVRVAATRVASRPHWEIADVVDEIRDDQLADDGTSGMVGEAVQAVFDWSYARLAPGQAQVFRWLGWHPGTEFSVAAVAALSRLRPRETTRCLEALAELHLVEPVGRHRYRMHDLLHAYARTRAHFDTADEQHAASERVLTWYAYVAQSADQVLYSGFPSLDVELNQVGVAPTLDDRGQALAWLTAEQPTLHAAARAALEYEIYAPVLALAAASRFLTYLPRPLWTVRLEIEALGITAARALDNPAAEFSLRERHSETLSTLERWDEAEAGFASLDTPRNPERYTAFIGLGQVNLEQRRLQRARDYYQQALPLARFHGLPRTQAVIEGNLATIAIELGEYAQALVHIDRERALRHQAGDQVGHAYSFYRAATAQLAQGNHTAALELAEQALAGYRELPGTGKLVAPVLELAATCLDHAGDLPRAADYLQCAVTLYIELGLPAEATEERWREVTARATAPPSS